MDIKKAFSLRGSVGVASLVPIGHSDSRGSALSRVYGKAVWQWLENKTQDLSLLTY